MKNMFSLFRRRSAEPIAPRHRAHRGPVVDHPGDTGPYSARFDPEPWPGDAVGAESAEPLAAAVGTEPPREAPTDLPAYRPLVIGPVFPTGCVPVTGPARIPFRPDTALDHWSVPAGAAMLAASIRGPGHRRSGAPRQDDMVVLGADGGRRVIVVVADGVSAAADAHIGATTASRYAAGWLDSRCADLPADQIPWAEMIEHLSWQILQTGADAAGLSADADDQQRAAAAADVATTVSCAVLDRTDDGRMVGSAVAVGDSGIRLLTGDEFFPLSGDGAADADLFESSAVVPLPYFRAEDVAPITVTVEPGEHLLIGTDGVWDALGGGGGPLGGALTRALRRPEPALLEFAQIVDFVKDSFDDDRTLVAVWPQEGTDD